VLEEMGEAGLALRLVLRAHVIPNADRDDRRLAILVDDHAQAVVEREALVMQIELRRLRCPCLAARARLGAGLRSEPETRDEEHDGECEGRSDGLGHCETPCTPVEDARIITEKRAGRPAKRAARPP